MAQRKASSVPSLSPSTWLLIVTSVQPRACFVYFHAVTYSKQENCFPYIKHWKDWKFMFCNIQFESLLFISWLNRAVTAVQSWQASSLLALLTQIGAVNKNTTK